MWWLISPTLEINHSFMRRNFYLWLDILSDCVLAICHLSTYGIYWCFHLTLIQFSHNVIPINPIRETFHVSHFSWREKTGCTRISRDCSRRRVSNISIFCQKPSFCQQSLQSSPLPSTNWEVGGFLSPLIINWKLTIHTSVAPKKSLEVQEKWLNINWIDCCGLWPDFRLQSRAQTRS